MLGKYQRQVNSYYAKIDLRGSTLPISLHPHLKHPLHRDRPGSKLDLLFHHLNVALMSYYALATGYEAKATAIQWVIRLAETPMDRWTVVGDQEKGWRLQVV